MRIPLPEDSLLQNGLYRLGPLVGTGGFSLTYRATQSALQLPVAIKEFFPTGCTRDPETLEIKPGSSWDQASFDAALDLFQKEGSTIERFQHHNIVRVHGQFKEHASAYLVEELLLGETLGEGLARAGTMPQTQALQVAQQVGLGLVVVHAGGLIHSDIKPDNLFWTVEDRYVILDFGVSRGYLSERAARESMAAVSPGYSPPEQYERGITLTPAADVYALAATLYHLLVGYPPVDARRRMKGEKLTAIRSLNDTVGADIEAAVFAGLSLDPKRRPSSMRKMMSALGLETAATAHHEKPREFGLHAEKSAHAAGVAALALHKPRLYSAGKDGRICVWSWPDLEQLGSLPAHLGPVNALAVSPDGGYLASGSASGEVKLWDSVQGVTLHTLVASGPAVQRLCFHPDGGFLIASFIDGTCSMLGPNLPAPQRWMAHKGAVNGLDTSPDGLQLATVADDKTLNIWRLPDARYLRSLHGHEKIVQSVRFSPDGRLLLTGSNDLSARLWDLSSGQELRHLKGHRGMVWDAAFTASPDAVVTVSADKCLRGFRVDSGRPFVTSEAHDGWTRALTTDWDEPLVATGGADGWVRVWVLPEP